jgi:hypothetical protein
LKNALIQLQKALEIRTRVDPLLAASHPLVADSLNNIGIVYGKKGDRAANTEMATKAYHIFLKRC